MRGLVGSVLRDLGILGPSRSRGDPVDVKEGMVFARHISSSVTETAEVAEVINDGSGNPHIRFRVSLRDQHGTHNEGTRVLALATFVQNYQRVT